MEDDKRIIFELRGYQEDTTEEIDKIYNRDTYNRFAAVVLPTGAGKSFVALRQILSMNNPDWSNKKRNGEINSANILYCAPSNEILSQIKMHIVKNIILSIPNLEKMTIAEIDELISKDYPSIRFRGINSFIKNEDDFVDDNASASEKINAIIRRLRPEDIDKLVKVAFPNLNLKCYAGVKDNKEEKDVLTENDVKNADFIILDEAHRVGAEKWGRNVRKLIGKAENKKILAITATPERQDSLKKDMMQGIARMIYGKKVPKKEYMAKEIYVLEAMRDGIVNSPDVVDTDGLVFLLKDGKNPSRYEKLVELYNKSNGSRRERLEKVLDEVESLIGISSKGYPKREIPEEELDKVRKDFIKKSIQKNLKNRNGKFIAFIPANRNKGEKNTREYFDDYMKEIKSYFEGVVDENGNPVEVSIDFLSSDSDVKDQGENEKTLKKFEGYSNTKGGIKILVAIDKLNEGVHVDGIDGAFMFRHTDSSNMYLQQSGRCISSMDPYLPLSKQPQTQLFDFVGNGISEIEKGTANRFSYSYELARLSEIEGWITRNPDLVPKEYKKLVFEKGGKIPNINAKAEDGSSYKEQAFCEYEARLACSIKYLQSRIRMYENNTFHLSDEEKEIVDKILEIAKRLEFDTISIGDRDVEPSEEELLGRKFLSLSPKEQRISELLEICERESKDRVDNSKDRAIKLINIVRVLKSHKPDLELPSGIMTRENSKNIKSDSVGKGIGLIDFLHKNFDEETVKRILEEIQDPTITGARNKKHLYREDEKYNFGEEVAFVRGLLFTSKFDQEKTDNSPIESFSLDEFANLGILDISKQATFEDIFQMFYIRPNDLLERIGGELYFRKAEMYPEPVRKERGVPEDIPPRSKKKFGLLKKLEDISLSTLRRYNNDGLDRDNYNRQGFRLENGKYIHRDTKEEFDEKGYMMRLNPRTNEYEYKCMPCIANAKLLMTMMVSQGKNFEEVCSIFAKKRKVSEEEISKGFISSFNKALKIYEKYPKIFDLEEDEYGEETFEGFYSILNKKNSKERKKHIDELYSVCPNIRSTIIRDSERIRDRIQEIEGIKPKSRAERNELKELKSKKKEIDEVEL